jgi:hypothetical protein
MTSSARFETACRDARTAGRRGAMQQNIKSFLLALR